MHEFGEDSILSTLFINRLPGRTCSQRMPIIYNVELHESFVWFIMTYLVSWKDEEWYFSNNIFEDKKKRVARLKFACVSSEMLSLHQELQFDMKTGAPSRFEEK